MKKNYAAAMAESTVKIRNLILQKPDISLEDLMRELHIKSQAAIYSVLGGLAGDTAVCAEQEFKVKKDGRRLTVKDIDDFFIQNPQKTKTAPKQPERLLYLYFCLHKAIPDGGLTFDAIKRMYIGVFANYGKVPEELALRRMIYRDLGRFNELEIGVDRSETTKKYCLRDKYLPKLSVESADTVYVSMLLYRDTLLDNAILGAKEQIEKAFFKDQPGHSQQIEERVFVMGDTLANPEAFQDNLGKLIRSVVRSFRLGINYINNEGKKSKRTLEPLGLVCKRGVWYLIARDISNQEIRTFRVDQILDLRVIDSEKFVYPAAFDLADHIGCSWGVYHNDKIETVRLKFSPRVAYRVKNLRYHASQSIAREDSDGSVILEFQVCGLLEMQSWILQWGNEVEVLEPPEMRESIRQAAQSIALKYESPAPKGKKRK